MLDDTTITPAIKSDSGKISIKKLIDSAAAKPKRQHKFKPNTFEVRPSSAAMCQGLAGGDIVAGNLLLGLLELWINTKTKIERPYGDGVRGYLFLPLDGVSRLTGLSRDQLYKRGFPPLKERGFITSQTGHLSHGDGHTQCQLYVDTDAVWSAVVGEYGLAEPTTLHENGATFNKWAVDRKRLPILFKRLFDEADGAVPQ